MASVIRSSTSGIWRTKRLFFQYRIEALCASTPHPDFEWYPYDSLGSFYTLAGLLTGERQYLLDLIGDKPVLDVGCGDGTSRSSWSHSAAR